MTPAPIVTNERTGAFDAVATGTLGRFAIDFMIVS
jgi:hypothetical protein